MHAHRLPRHRRRWRKPSSARQRECECALITHRRTRHIIHDRIARLDHPGPQTSAAQINAVASLTAGVQTHDRAISHQCLGTRHDDSVGNDDTGGRDATASRWGLSDADSHHDAGNISPITRWQTFDHDMQLPGRPAEQWWACRFSAAKIPADPPPGTIRRVCRAAWRPQYSIRPRTVCPRQHIGMRGD